MGNVRHKACISRAHHPVWEIPVIEVKTSRDSLHFHHSSSSTVLLLHSTKSVFSELNLGARAVWTMLAMLLALLSKTSTLVKEIWTRTC